MRNTNGNSGMPIGIIMIMFLQVLTIIYCIFRYISLFNVISIAGKEFGLSDPQMISLVYLVIGAINLFSLIGTYKKHSWSKWIYVIFSLIPIWWSAVMLIGSRFSDIFSIMLIGIFIIIILYLLISIKVRRYYERNY